jgi:2-C-methyl-D-erythritol 4-phosphate cytidylyltransferase
VDLGGRPLVAWCLDAFAASASVDRAVIAAPSGRAEEIAALAPPGLELTAIDGGDTRTESVALALALIDDPFVAVHDAARPLVTAEQIDSLVATLAAQDGVGGVIAAAPITDTVKRTAEARPGAGEHPPIAATEPRELLWAAQTPQVFRTETLRRAHADASAGEATDDAMLLEAAGETVLIEPSPASNLKVTTATDLRLAELLLGERHGPGVDPSEVRSSSG